MIRVRNKKEAEQAMLNHIACKFPEWVFDCWNEPPHIVEAFRQDGNPPKQFGAVALLRRRLKEPHKGNGANHRLIVRVGVHGVFVKSSLPRITNGSKTDRRQRSEIVGAYQTPKLAKERRVIVY
jgi:hypothetical protein